MRPVNRRVHRAVTVTLWLVGFGAGYLLGGLPLWQKLIVGVGAAVPYAFAVTWLAEVVATLPRFNRTEQEN